MKPKLPLIERYQLPHPHQMGGQTNDQTLGGCLINFVLLIFFGVLALSCMGVKVSELL